MFNRRKLLKYSAHMAAVMAVGTPGIAFAQQKRTNFSLDFRVYGGNSPFILGESSGIFSDLGFTANVEGSSGSADSIRRVATGSHDFGYADIQTLIEFTATNPEAAPKLIMPILDNSPQGIMTIGDQKLTSLEDLKGKKIGVAANSAATKIIPIVLRLNNIDPSEIEFMSVDVRIRDTMLLRGEVDGVVGYDYTSMFNFLDNGVPRDNVNILYFSDAGFDFPTNSLIASQRIIESDPDLCRAVALGSARAWRATIADPEAAIAATVAREPLLKTDVELERIKFIIDTHVDTPTVREHGIGQFQPDRINEGLALMAQAFEWEKAPAIEEFYDDSFLPDAEELKIFG